MLVDFLWAGGAIAVAAYMLVALLRPERF
ncbi:potassium-transporting ATPase subunit F [Phenylobacterium sp. 58.2.17]|nr:potassium-transporting ATPase subunit F [Phenylobacterium sp.]